MSRPEYIPLFWVVKEQSGRILDPERNILLGDKEDDAFRVGVTVTQTEDGMAAEATVVYPCRICWWQGACEDGCHS